jgi:hypothetical protein
MTTQRFTYFGEASLVAAFVKMLREEGLEAQWIAPEKRRSFSDIRQEVVVTVVTTMSAGATNVRIELAQARFESYFPGIAEIRQEEGDPDES